MTFSDILIILYNFLPPPPHTHTQNKTKTNKKTSTKNPVIQEDRMLLNDRRVKKKGNIYLILTEIPNNIQTFVCFKTNTV